MRRCGKLAPVLLVCVIAPGCHQKTLPAPPAIPQASSPSPESRRPKPAQAPPATTAPPETSPAATSIPAAQPPPGRAPVPAAKPEFRLGQSVTPEEQRANSALIDQHLQSAAQALAAIGKKHLTNDEKTTLAQIRGFIAQAQQMRATDVVRARSLAERADVLTQDLLSRVRAR